MTDSPRDTVPSVGFSLVKVVAIIVAVLGGGIYFLVSIGGSVIIALAVALGMGYGLSAITKIPLPLASGLALGSMAVTILFYYGRRLLGTLLDIRALIEAGEDDEDDEDDDRDDNGGVASISRIPRRRPAPEDRNR